jgi:hypothetical protein
MLRYGVRLFWFGLQFSYTGLRPFYPGIHFGYHPFMNTWRLHIEMIEAETFRTFIRIYFLFKIERLSANIKLALHKAFVRCIITYAWPAWEFAADNLLL